MRMNLIRSLIYKQNKCNHNGNSTHICHFLAAAPRAIIKTSSTRHLWTFLLCRHFRNVPKCRVVVRPDRVDRAQERPQRLVV